MAVKTSQWLLTEQERNTAKDSIRRRGDWAKEMGLEDKAVARAQLRKVVERGNACDWRFTLGEINAMSKEAGREE